MLLALLYETVGNGAAWTPFLDALGATFGAGVGNVVLHDFASSEGMLAATSSKDAAVLEAYVTYYDRLNPWLPFAATAPVGTAFATDQMLPHVDLLKTEFYQDWLRPQHLGGGVVVTVERDPSRVMAISTLFPHETFERQPGAVAYLQQLTPHLLRVAQLNRRFAALETRAAAAEGALAQRAIALLVVNAARRVTYLNRPAQIIIDADDGLAARHAILDTTNPRDSQTLAHLVGSALQSQRNLHAPRGGVMRVTRRSARRPYEVLVAALADTRISLGITGSLAAIFIHDPETRANTAVESWRQIYALTAAESRLMQALVDGGTLDEIASRFKVARETLRTQLKSIFQKTGANSQIDLMRLATRSVAASFR